VKAAGVGDYGTVKTGLAMGISVNEKNAIGTTSLYAAINGKNRDVVDLLLKNGADVNVEVHGTTPLIDASYNGNIDMIELLLSHGANIDAKDSYGRTALMVAIQYGKPEVAEVLKRSSGR
jgi:ankyrin repeat protein